MSDPTNHSGSKYLRTIHPADGQGEPIRVDVYSVLVAFGVLCPGRQHAIKKILCAGLRGKNSEARDIAESLDALRRSLDILGHSVTTPDAGLFGSMMEAENHKAEMESRNRRLKYKVIMSGEKWRVIRDDS